MNILVLIPSSKHARNVPRDLVYGCWCKGRRIGGITFPPLPQLSVATVLKQANFSVDLLDASMVDGGMDGVSERIGAYDAVVMLTSTMSVREDALSLKGFKSKNPRLKTVVFGAHPTFMPRQTLSLDGIDIIVLREAEQIVKELFEAYRSADPDLRAIQGIGWKDAGRPVINELHPFIENLDDLPIPDRGLLPEGVDYFNPIVKRLPYTTMITSRGCPGMCTYCTSPPFYGRHYRMQSSARVLEEIACLAERGYREIFFRDETFTICKNGCMRYAAASLSGAWT